METMDIRFKLDLNGGAKPEAIIEGDKYRFTILTSKLIRIEYAEDGVFEDRSTQSIWNRNFANPEFRVVEDQNNLEIITESLHLYYKKGKFESNSLYIDAKNNYSAYNNRWYYGDKPASLKGTCRTLDEVDGATELEEGILSKNGFSFIDDSKSLVITNDGWVEPRKEGIVDIYFFAYGREYLECLRDFYKLTGPTPLLPRYSLGNWWSRYWKYDEKELSDLMNRFTKEDIPFSVCVMDMDWHLVNIPSKYGSGWTGYTWNKELFNNPPEFMKWLHDKNLKVTLNLHPADGVKAHEEMYEPMAKELNIDYKNEDPIPFNIADKKFLDAYFKYLHHPQEKDGVDFWWIDWQQGSTSAFKGLDPLWMLNHYHTYDHGRDGKRPLIFSRYAGVGSHRYPLGFSGDSVISWDSYKFQPYFTSTASNIGYSWWSHDIGGHFKGVKDDELSARWLQFGVFSPITRLHSSCSVFNGKEPWRFGKDACSTMKDHLRLRHKLVPYLYTMNWRTHNDLIPMVQPMYYNHPHNEEAYNVPNQYMFGSEFMVCSITEPINKSICMAGTDAWLPEGKWIDFFDGTVYSGNKNIRLFRGIERQPVLAKAGAIVPMAKHFKNDNNIENPKSLEILVFPGKDNSFELYEDNGENMDYAKGSFVKTNLEVKWGENTKFVVGESKGDLGLIPEQRDIQVVFRGIECVDQVIVLEDNIEVLFEKEYSNETRSLMINVLNHRVDSKLEVILRGETPKFADGDKVERIYNLLNRAQIDFYLKDTIYSLVNKSTDMLSTIMEIQCMKLDRDLHDALLEVLIG